MNGLPPMVATICFVAASERTTTAAAWRLAGSGVGDGEAGGGDDDGWRSHADSSFERLFFVCFAAFVAFMYSRLRLAIVSGSGEKSKTSTETHLS